VMWAPPGWRPRFLRSDAPISEEAGTLIVSPGDPPRTLEIRARDLSGHSTRRSIVIRPGDSPPPPTRGWWKEAAAAATLPGEITSLPGGAIRWSLPVKEAPDGVEFQVGNESRRGLPSGERWNAIFPSPWPSSHPPARVPFAAKFARSGVSRETGSAVLGARRSPGESLQLEADGLRLEVPAGALFETGFVFVDRGSAPGEAPGLVYLGRSWISQPSNLPLRRASKITVVLPPGQPLEGVGLCRFENGGWQWLGAERDPAKRTVSATSRELGPLALFRDVTAPRVALQRPPGHAATKPYSRWALEASVIEAGSGVDARASWLEIDGARVPTEWDPEAGRLRWRPVRPPRAGTHRVAAVVADRAGNTTRESGSFRVGR